MVTSNIIQRTLKIKYHNSAGTGFTITFNNQYYLISAKHIFEGMVKEDVIEVMNEGIRKKLRVDPIFCDNLVDIIIFPLQDEITPNLELIPSTAGMQLGQDAFFLGFPFGWQTESGNLNNNYPFPFVKKCSISAFDFSEIPTKIYLDGHNNIGFSGGPLVFTNKSSGKMHVGGVISSYIYDLDESKRNEGIRENSGIFLAHSIKHVTDVLKKRK